MLNYSLLALTALILVTYVIRSRAAMQAFKQEGRSTARRSFFLKRTGLSLACFTGLSMVILLVLGRLASLTALPAEFVPLRPADAGEADLSMLLGLMTGISIGALVLYAIWRFVLGKRSQPVLGDVAALFPRNYTEALVQVPMAINAGFSEELFFRLALPLLLTTVSGSAQAAMLIAAAVFGLMHWYQGWRGVIVTGLAGLFLTSLYLRFGSIWAVVMIHALIDLIALVVRPSISLWLDRRRT